MKTNQTFKSYYLEMRLSEMIYTEEEYKKLEEEYDNFKKQVSDDMKEIAKNQLENIGLFNKLEEENRKLKESLDIATKCSSKEEDGIIRLNEENNKLKLHIEAKDKAYTALLKDYEELKEDNKRLRAEIEEWLNAIRDLHSKY